jgi:DNA methylase
VVIGGSVKHVNVVAEIKAVDQVITDDYAVYQGDACELVRAIPDASVHFGIHSPPFIGLYKFSNYDRDISNNEGEQFWRHYRFLIDELLRVTKPGRLHSVHCMQLPRSKTRDGFIGIRDFRGEIVRSYEDAGWIFHSEVCIWKDPVIAQQRTKSLRLLHKQITKDSSMSGQGLADYIVTFRKHGENAEPISGMFDEFVGAPPASDYDYENARTEHGIDISREAYDHHRRQVEAEGRKAWPFDMWASVLVWQRYASPVWMDIDQTRTLQYRAGRDPKDEQHISPLQLDVIERCIDLWSNPGDVILTPFLGIGSEVYSAVRMGRRGVGFELKPSYFAQAIINLADAKPKADLPLFGASA